MNYDAILLELLSRIQKLEQEVSDLHQKINEAGHGGSSKGIKTISTNDIRNFIKELKSKAQGSGENELVLTASEIHKALRLKQRFPMVCNAMRQCMSDKDIILHDTSSGFSSTLKIKYYLSDKTV